MARPAERLLDQALRLPERDRAALAARLIQSLDKHEDPDAMAAWGREIARRLGELGRGDAVTVPWSAARRMIHGEFDEPQSH